MLIITWLLKGLELGGLSCEFEGKGERWAHVLEEVWMCGYETEGGALACTGE